MDLSLVDQNYLSSFLSCSTTSFIKHAERVRFSLDNRGSQKTEVVREEDRFWRVKMNLYNRYLDSRGQDTAVCAVIGQPSSIR